MERKSKKKCPNCGKVFYYDDWIEKQKEMLGKNFRTFMANNIWKQKTFCTSECLKEYRSKLHKNCLHCGKIYYSNKDISASEWKSRKFCSRECSLEYFRIKKLADSMGTDYNTLKKELLKIAEKKGE